MTAIEIEDCLNSMNVVVDTREQPSKRSAQRLSSLGVPYRRQTMNYGDYTYNFILPDGTELYVLNETISGDVVIERKMNLEELSQCFCQSRKRFTAEFERIKEHNATVYLLIEDGNWEKLIHGKYNTGFKSKAFFASLTAFMARYQVIPIFCQHEISGQIIHEILYRELKERLENGFYG